MLQETETEETLGFFCHIFVMGDISIEGGSRAPCPQLRLCAGLFCFGYEKAFYNLQS